MPQIAFSSGDEVQERTEGWACGIFTNGVLGFGQK